MNASLAVLCAGSLMVLATGCQALNSVTTPVVEGKQMTFEAPLDGARRALVTLASLVSDVVVEPLDADSAQLIAADIGYVGNLTTRSDGAETRTVVIRDELNSFSYNGPRIAFDVGLNTVPALRLDVSSMSGDARLNLTDFNLTGLSVSTASGRVEAQLPASAAPYPVTVDTSSGDVQLTVADGAAVQFETIRTASGSVTITSGSGDLAATAVNTSSGNITLTFNGAVTADFRVGTASGAITVDAPEGAPLRLEVVTNASGAVTVPDSMARIEGSGRVGIWETVDYQNAQQRILIVVTADASGDITIR
jgi:hypothetical protein